MALLSLHRSSFLHLRDNVIASKSLIPNSYHMNKKKTFSEFQTQSSFIIKYLLICLRFSELIFHFLWMDPIPAIFGWIQYWLCTPISYLIC